jgi:hypothetical protein
MEIVDKDKFDGAKNLPKPVKKEDLADSDIRELNEKEFKQMLEDMQNPVKAQQHLAVQIKNFLDQRIGKEIKEKGYLSDHTRRWVESYNSILEKIQKALYGDKSVNLHLHKVTHSQIAEQIRRYSE